MPRALGRARLRARVLRRRELALLELGDQRPQREAKHLPLVQVSVAEQRLGVAQVIVHRLVDRELHRVGLWRQRLHSRAREHLNWVQTQFRFTRLNWHQTPLFDRRLHTCRHVRPRKALGQQLLDLRLALVRGGRQQVGRRLGGEMGRQQDDRRQVEPAVGEGAEDRGELPCRPTGANQAQRGVLGQAPLLDEVGEHRGMSRRQVQATLIDLGQVCQHLGADPAFPAQERAEIANQHGVGQV